METYIYIDSQNIFQAIKWDWEIIDRKKFFIFLKDKYRTQHIYYYVWYIEKNKKLYDFLKKLGYIVIFKRTWILPDWSIKWNVDVDIAIWSVHQSFISHIWHVIIISWDGDYNSLVLYHQKKWIKVTIVAPTEKSCSKLLEEVCQGRLSYVSSNKSKLEFKI